jgi:WD40 repeat protein
MLPLIGHAKDVRAVTYTPNGRLVSGGADRTVRVWNPLSGDLLRTVRAKGPVYAVAAAPDGAVAFAGRYPPRAEANVVTAFDPEAGAEIARYELRTLGTVWERTPTTGLPTPVTRPVPRSVWSLGYSADGRYLAAAVRQPGGGNLPNGAGGYWWDRTAARNHGPLGDDSAYSLAFAPAGPAAAIAGNSRLGFYSSPEIPDPTASTRLTAAWAEAVAFLPGGSRVAVGAGSHLYLIDVSGTSKLVRVKTRFRAVTAVAAAPDGRAVLVGGKPGAVEVFDPATGSVRAAYDFGLGIVHALAVAPDGLTFAAAGETGLAVCDLDW